MVTHKIIRILLLLVLGGALYGKCMAQTTSSPITVVPPSPNAASLMKFSDIPVSAYTGAPSVDVPLYTVRSGDITVPISLSYHASGIRLAEEAGNVGLGWALNAGGAVSRSILDKDDFAGDMYFNGSLPEIDNWPIGMNAYLNAVSGYSISVKDPVTNLQKVIDLSNYFSSGAYDIEPDLYSFSFPGHSGKFIIRRNREVLLHKPEDINIEFEQAGASFTITDESGFVYFFQARESSISSSEGGASKTSSWYLSEIRSPKKSTVRFFYKQQDWVSVQGAYSQVDRLGCTISGFESSQAPQMTYQNILIDSIAFDHGYAKFLYEGNREDLDGGKKLTQLKIYSHAAANKTRLLKEYHLQYSYFNNGVAEHVKGYKRLKLESVTEMSGAIQLPPYKFAYTEPSNTITSLTHKQSNSIDHWGYYNGYGNGFDPNNLSLNKFIPRYRGAKHIFDGINGFVIGQTYVDIAGANRTPDPEKMKLFSLNEIIYPTGGRSVFELEAHDFDEEKSRNGYQYEDEMELVEKEVFLNFSQRGETSDTLDLSKRVGDEIKIAVTFRYSCADTTDCQNKFNAISYGHVNFEYPNNRIDLKDFAEYCPNGVCTTGIKNITLSTGTSGLPYKATINPLVGDFFQGVYVRVIWTELKRMQSSYPDDKRYAYAGGLRVRQVSDYDHAGKVAKSRKYEYHFKEDRDGNGVAETYSHGRRMSVPSYYRYETLPNQMNDECQKCVGLTRYSSSVSTLSNAAQGSVVGYDKVTEYIIDGSVSQGKTEYYYENKSDSVYFYRPGIPSVNGRLPGIPNKSNNRNGLLVTKIDYASNGATYRKVQETTNTYTSSRKKALFTFRYDDPGRVCSGQSAMHVMLFPALLSERILLTKTVTKQYDIGDEKKCITTLQEHHYENEGHSLPTRVLTYDSDGALLTTTNKYPLDEIVGLTASAEQARQSLVSKHVVTPVLEQTVTKGNEVVTIGRTNYKVFDSGLVLPENVEVRQGSFPLEKRVEFQRYDSKGNITQQAKADDILLSYVWGYSQTLPIAEIQNASYAEVETALGGAVAVDALATSATLSQAQLDQLNSLRTQLPESMVTTYTYDPLVGVTSVTDPNGRTTSYEYDGFGRLQAVKDGEGNVLQSHEYHYAGQ